MAQPDFWTLDHVGNVHNLSGRYQEALETFVAARDSFDELGDRDRSARCRLNAGNAFFGAGRPKQAVVTELLSRHFGEPADRRVTIEALGEPGAVIGRHAFRPFEPDVLTLEEVAELLCVAPEAVAELACSGELPGRRIGAAWRFARVAVLDWLAQGSVPAQ